MDLHEALYTTRAMRRVKPDPIPLEIQRRIIDAAVRAPSSANNQNWRFLLIDSPETKTALAPLYRTSVARLWDELLDDWLRTAHATNDETTLKIYRSAQWLGDHFEQVPLYMMVFARHDLIPGGSAFPAVWSAQLAARAEGVGSSISTLLTYFENDTTRSILGVPDNEDWQMSCLVSFGYPLGRWGLAARRPAHEVCYRERWGEPPGFEIPDPLWRKPLSPQPALLIGGPQDLPEAARTQDTPPDVSHLRVPHQGGYEHFERDHTDSDVRTVFRWTYRTKIAE